MNLDDEELKATRKANGADRRDVNDIEVLEELLKYKEWYKKHGGEDIGYREIQAIENLIKAYKEKKEEVKHLKKFIDEEEEQITELNNKNCELELKMQQDYIPKSLIKEKLEELKEEDLKIYDTDSEDVRIAKYEQRAVLQVLEELLKGE